MVFWGLGVVCCRYLHTRRCVIEIEMFKSGAGAGNISPHYGYCRVRILSATAVSSRHPLVTAAGYVILVKS